VQPLGTGVCRGIGIVLKMDLADQTDASLVFKQFYEDINHIALAWIHQEELSFATAEQTPSRELIFRWLDYCHRRVEPRPRKVHASKLFPKNLPATVATGLSNLINLLQAGGDINPYQSKTILKNDTSASKKHLRTDQLWADWGIHHLHLTDVPLSVTSKFSRRDCSDGQCYVAFLWFYEDDVLLIDVKNHSEISSELWANADLLKTVKDAWPQVMSLYELKAIMTAPQQTQISNDDRYQLRRHGINPAITIDDTLYAPPNSGLSTAGTAMKVTEAVIRLRRWLKALAIACLDGSGRIQEHLKAESNLENKFQLMVTPEGLTIFENNIQKAFTLEKAYPTECDLIAPKWMYASLFANKSN
jgi:hypothetical protein